MDEYPHFYFEDDIRTKVVTACLANRGFGPPDISVEYSFEIHLGRKVFSIVSKEPKKKLLQVFRPRADVLVRFRRRGNLLVVDVKAFSEPLDDSIKERRICCSRLLCKGYIWSFVISTKSNETKIYDRIAEELIIGTTTPLDHPHVKAGFHVRVNDAKHSSPCHHSLPIIISKR